MQNLDTPVVVQHVEAKELSARIAKSLHIYPERRYTINVQIVEETVQQQRSQLMELFNAPSGAFESPEEIDLFIRSERDAWV